MLNEYIFEESIVFESILFHITNQSYTFYFIFYQTWQKYSITKYTCEKYKNLTL